MVSVSDPKDIEKVWKLASKIRTCMLVSEEARMLHGRPMAAYPDEHGNAIYFLTDVRGHKNNEISEKPDVCLCFMEGSKYLCISGDGVVTDDRAKIRELWNAFAEAWFEGPDDPNIRLLRVAPHEAHYWETPGKAVTAVNMAIAAATGTHPKAGKERKVDMH